MKNEMMNEILTYEQLDGVAGGSVYEMADDSRFLNILNGSTDRYGDGKIMLGGYHDEIKKGWATVGIKADLNYSFCGKNDYYLNGKKITQEEARQHAMKVTGHYMTTEDWDW